MGSENRTGRVSSIDYAAGTYEVTYFDRGKSVTKQINAQSNGEYKMPSVGQIVSVSHNSNGTAAGTTTGSVWNKTNAPAEGYKGLYRKEYGEKRGQAYERYDANTGVYTQYTNTRTGRTCKGEIYDEAEGPISHIAGGQIQIKSSGASVGIQAQTGFGVVAGTNMSLEAGTYASLEAGGDMSISAGGKYTLEVTGKAEETYKAAVTRKYKAITETVVGKIKRTVTGEIELELNGATITISTSGDISIESPTKIEVKAPEINVESDSGDIKINNISLKEHTHKNGGSGEPQ